MFASRFDQDSLTRLRPYLQINEKVLWTGAPDKNGYFTRSDIFQIPFGLVFFLFSLFWFFGALSATQGEDGLSALLFPLFGLPFVAIGLYMAVGRFFTRRCRNKRLLYAVTDRNVIVLIRSPFGERMRTATIDGLREMQQEIKKGGNGTLTFGNPSSNSKWLSDNGLDLFFSATTLPLAFQNIPDVKIVYDLIVHRREELVDRQRA